MPRSSDVTKRCDGLLCPLAIVHMYDYDVGMTALEVPAAGSPEPGEPGVVAELWQRIDRLHADVAVSYTHLTLPTSDLV